MSGENGHNSTIIHTSTVDHNSLGNLSVNQNSIDHSGDAQAIRDSGGLGRLGLPSANQYRGGMYPLLEFLF